MNPKEILAVVLREMTAFGRGWQLDWADFDGHTLRDQLNTLQDWARSALAGRTDKAFTEGSEFEKDQEL